MTQLRRPWKRHNATLPAINIIDPFTRPAQCKRCGVDYTKTGRTQKHCVACQKEMKPWKA